MCGYQVAPDKRLGEKTAAIIEVKDDMECSREEIDSFCEGMPRSKRPKRSYFCLKFQEMRRVKLKRQHLENRSGVEESCMPKEDVTGTMV